MNLNKTISALRTERGMTQEKLAELIGDMDARVSARESLFYTVQCEERDTAYRAIRSDPRYEAILARLQTT